MNETKTNDSDEQKIATSNNKIQCMEYQECSSLNRFVTGVRYSFFATHSTFFAIILTAYRYVWLQQDNFANMQPWLLFLIAFFGFSIAFLALMVETNNVRVLLKCQNRLVKLEKEMGISNGVYSQLTREAQEYNLLPGLQTLAVYIFSWSVITIWLGLPAYSINQLLF